MWAAIAQAVERLATAWTIGGSNPGGGEIFRMCARPALGLTQPSIQCVPGFLPIVKRTERGVKHPSPI